MRMVLLLLALGTPLVAAGADFPASHTVCGTREAQAAERPPATDPGGNTAEDAVRKGLGLAPLPKLDYAQLARTWIPVEKQTGRGDSYDDAFSGWIGLLNFNREQPAVRIRSQTAGLAPLVEQFTVTDVQEHGNSVTFIATDTDPFTAGMRYRTMISLQDDGRFRSR
jgi:hypothetical protein